MRRRLAWLLFVIVLLMVIRLVAAPPAVDGGSMAQPLATATALSDDDLAERILEAGNRGLRRGSDHAAQGGQRPELRSVQVNGDVVTLDFNAEMLAAYDEVRFEAAFSAVISAIEGLPSLATRPVTTYEVTIAGVPLPQAITERDGRPAYLELPLPAAEGDEASQAQGSGPLAGRRIALSPGHGWTWYEHCNCYLLQRGYHWGIVEDFVNAEIIMLLADILVDAGATVYPVRNPDSTAGIGLTGHPRWQENARRYLTDLGLPGSVVDTGSSAWASDLRSRPLYANAVDADILISLHNNGGCNNQCGTRGGTYIMYDTGNGYATESLALGRAVEAALVGRIRSDYDANWYNRSVAGFNGSYGENRLATRPSIIIELAFMDQQYPDNAYLQDQTFRSVAAYGIYEGLLAYFNAGPPPETDTPTPTPTRTPTARPQPTLTPTPDGPPGVCDVEVDNAAELIAAVNDANSAPGEQVICLGAAEISFTAPDGGRDSALPTITDDLIVQAEGARLERNSTAPFRLASVSNGAHLTLYGVDITGFATDADGGALYVDMGATLAITYSTLRENQAANGGAVFADGGNLRLSYSLLQGNQAGGAGGALAIVYDAAAENSAELGAVTIRGNIAGELGGGLYIWDVPTSVQASVIAENQAQRGGGVFTSGYGSRMTTVIDSQVEGNSAIYGGGIYGPSSRLNMTGGSVSHNAATWGGGMYVLNTARVTLDGVSINGNTAAEYGAGIYNNNHSQLTVTESQLQDNKAVNIAGALYNRGSSKATIVASVVQQNDAAFGAAFYQAGDAGALIVAGSCVMNNSNTATYVSGANSINAEDNWWGAADGPSGVGPGQGDAVSSGVVYAPFLIAMPITCDSSRPTPPPTLTPTPTTTPTSTPTPTPDGYRVLSFGYLELLAALQAVESPSGLHVVTLDITGPETIRLHVETNYGVAQVVVQFHWAQYQGVFLIMDVLTESGTSAPDTMRATIMNNLPVELTTALDYLVRLWLPQGGDVENIWLSGRTIYMGVIPLP